MPMIKKKIQINQLELGEFYTNCYVVWSAGEEKCIVIDPAAGGDKILAVLQQLAVVPEAILLTHGHFDHILAVPALQKQWPNLPVYCHKLDCPIELTEEYMGKIYPTVSAFSNLIHYGVAGPLCIGGFNMEILHTPGHTQGSVTIRIEDALFTGDTLFKRDIGRTDFEGGDPSQMMRSLAKLMALSGDCNVLPGHDEITTMGDEKKYNPYLKSIQKRLL